MTLAAHGYIHAQPGNLIYNGDFEVWDTTQYPKADVGDLDLCKLFDGTQRNARYTAFCIKGLDCVRWMPWYPESSKHNVQITVGNPNPAAYKNCYPDQYINTDFKFDTDLPSSETFIGTSIFYDTIANQYKGGKFFLYLPLNHALVKGKTYRLDFDIKSHLMTNNCRRDTTEAFGCKGFGFGFTEKKPDFIQSPITFETDLVPEVKLDYFNSKIWTNMTRYFVADSNSKYIIFGFFDKGMSQIISSKNKGCDLGVGLNTVRAAFMLDNLLLKSVNDTLLPNDTTVCINSSIKVECIQKKAVRWKIDGNDLPGKSTKQVVQLNTSGFSTIIATDSLISDTMTIKVVDNPVSIINQVDSLCNKISNFSASPTQYSYTWLPEGIEGSYVKLQGENPRQVIVEDNIGCKTTYDIKPRIIETLCGSFYIPNAFSPNNDGTNDLFTVRGEGIENLKIEIFNMWGEKVIHSTGVAAGWDGKYKGQDCQQGIYLYKISVSYLKDNKVVTEFVNGTVNLLR